MFHYRTLLIFLVLWSLPAGAAGRFSITEWGGSIALDKNGEAIVTERLKVDFGRQKRHGLKRWIPTAYRDPSGFHYDVRLKMGAVTNGSGDAQPVAYGRDGRNLTLRIGDPERFAPNRNEYDIEYTVRRAWIHQEEMSAFRWNLTGNEWEIPIDKVDIVISLPEGLASNDPNLRFYCFTGRFGSTASDCVWEPLEGGKMRVKAGPFRSREGISIELEIPPGIVLPATLGKKLAWLLADNWMLGIPLVVLALMLFLWSKNGRDRPGDRQSIMPEYHPPEDLRPAEAGTLIDEKVDMRDITSSILDLAVRGYLEIEERKKDGLILESKELHFRKLKPSDSELKPFEEKLLNGLFAGGKERVSQSDLENHFYKDLALIKNELYHSLTDGGYFVSRPDRVRQGYWGVGFLALAGGVAMFFSGYLFKIPWGISLTLSGVFVAVIGTFMPARTRKGSDATNRVLGFLEFANRVDKDRLERMGADLFDRYLPYAVALGVEKSWAKKFEGMDVQPPSWYRGDYGSHYTPYWLVYSWGYHSSGLHRSMTSTPRGQGGSSGGGFSGGFGGGGFSGGGFGGGGGGGW